MQFYVLRLKGTEIDRLMADQEIELFDTLLEILWESTQVDISMPKLPTWQWLPLFYALIATGSICTRNELKFNSLKI
jgi:hypothetical protein